jgi:hypothetical protein
VPMIVLPVQIPRQVVEILDIDYAHTNKRTSL